MIPPIAPFVFSLPFLLISQSALAVTPYELRLPSGGTPANAVTQAPTPSTATTCLELLAEDPATPSGAYTLSNGDYRYCDMTTNGGGWTLVVAQFSADPLPNWNEGIQPDYDPTLVTSKSFTLSSAELPPHTETAWGKQFDVTAIDRFNFVYTTGDIPVTLVTGLNLGNSYQVHRSANSYYGGHDPEGVLYTPPPAGIPWSGYSWINSLTIDQLGGAALTWSYSAMNPLATERGTAMQGVPTYGSVQTYAWTVWVR